MRQRFVPDCAGLEHRLALSMAFGFTTAPPPSPPATVSPPAPPPTDSDPGDPTDTGTDPGDGGTPTGVTVAIKVFPTNSGSTSTPVLPA